MKTELFPVRKVFSDVLYRIPDYQRGYSWDINQLRDFWLDLEQLQPNSKHYVGVLTLEKVLEDKWTKWEDDFWIIKSRGFTPYYVVDGQQRLTTIIILIQSILENVTCDYLNSTNLEDIKKKYIFDSKPEDSSRSYIFGYEKDNPSYEYLKTEIFSEKSDKHYPKEETIYTKNLLNAKLFFEEKLKKMTMEEIDTVFSKITQQFVFNAYEIDSDIDVFITFETMNNRGKPLTTLELLKNRLIFLATKLQAPEGTGDKLRRTINDSWKSAYHYLGKNENRIIADDNFLCTFLVHFYLNHIEKISLKGDESSNLRYKFDLIMERYKHFLLNRLFTHKRINVQENIDSSPLPPITREFIYKFSQELKDSVQLY